MVINWEGLYSLKDYEKESLLKRLLSNLEGFEIEEAKEVGEITLELLKSEGWLLIEGQLYKEVCFENIDSSSIKEIMKNFNKQGVDDLEIKKDNEVITIGYFKENPVDCVKIRGNKITHIVFDRQEKLNWLFNLMDNQTFIECDL
ncbi:MAG: hypothetical protein E6X34_11390 [Clostridium sp.]|uniref:hypothetical protein n=1 Tax=Clostridium sp. TaxID=1506 RepID=UPI00290D8C74|nr:hypothetical protein [Clostridium sp.]MDU4939048.1 hypothetical protein [Clostridium sp.]